MGVVIMGSRRRYERTVAIPAEDFDRHVADVVAGRDETEYEPNSGVFDELPTLPPPVVMPRQSPQLPQDLQDARRRDDEFRQSMLGLVCCGVGLCVPLVVLLCYGISGASKVPAGSTSPDSFLQIPAGHVAVDGQIVRPDSSLAGSSSIAATPYAWTVQNYGSKQMPWPVLVTVDLDEWVPREDLETLARRLRNRIRHGYDNGELLIKFTMPWGYASAEVNSFVRLDYTSNPPPIVRHEYATRAGGRVHRQIRTRECARRMSPGRWIGHR